MVEEATQKARVLIEALPYIQAFRDAWVVVKFGGSAMEDAATIEGVLQDIVFMECVGMRPIIVHGGGKAISRGMAAHGIQAQFIKGLRVTCEKTIEIVEKVIKGEVNPRIVDTINALGGRAEALHGDDVLHVTRKQETDPDTGEVVDWGFVGEPGEVEEGPIRAIVERGVIPVITPLGKGADGKVHNVNADVAAAAIAKALSVRKLVFLSDVPGLLRDPNDADSLIETLPASELERLIEEGVIGGGMLPKCSSGVEALHAGVRKVHMVDGRVKHSLLLEIFTQQGIGTEIVSTE
ncbi:MAG: acetylglutamate kinase [Kiritimatiellae bacterium]|nr:acetylglutamate kinase [Kiritimatiellia bacterium]